MKKSVKITFIAVAASFLSVAAADCAAQDTGGVKVKVTGIRTDSGKIMVSGGDLGDPGKIIYGMVQAQKDSVMCVLNGKLEPGASIYAFHDENGNFDLDRQPDGKPAEGCFAGTPRSGEDGMITITLVYYTPKEEEN